MKYLFICLSVFVLCQCTTTKINKDYYAQMDEYRKEKIQKYRTNTKLNLKESEINDYFPVDDKYNCNCRFEKSKDRITIDFPTSSGNVTEYLVHGLAFCNLEGKSFKLTVFAPKRRVPGYKDYLFLPVIDLTSGASTYGGGRYVDLYESDIDGNKINIDFNKLYNPYCAFRTGFACPLTPASNHVDIAIKAGEMHKNK